MIREREFDVLNSGTHRMSVNSFFGEADAAGADDSDFETHDPNLDAIKMPKEKNDREE
jgi:hypothetical protein